MIDFRTWTPTHPAWKPSWKIWRHFYATEMIRKVIFGAVRFLVASVCVFLFQMNLVWLDINNCVTIQIINSRTLSEHHLLEIYSHVKTAFFLFCKARYYSWVVKASNCGRNSVVCIWGRVVEFLIIHLLSIHYLFEVALSRFFLNTFLNFNKLKQTYKRVCQE